MIKCIYTYVSFSSINIAVRFQPVTKNTNFNLNKIQFKTSQRSSREKSVFKSDFKT